VIAWRCVWVERGSNPLVGGYLARCATKEFPPVAANDIANCNEVSRSIVEGSDGAMTDATVDFGGVRGSGFDDSFHWIERGFHRSVMWFGALRRATERNLAPRIPFDKKMFTKSENSFKPSHKPSKHEGFTRTRKARMTGKRARSQAKNTAPSSISSDDPRRKISKLSVPR